MSSHFVERCECGVIISQCRCPSKDKAQRVVTPCTHAKRETGDKPYDWPEEVEPERGVA